MTDTTFSILEQPADYVAQRLLGCYLERSIGDETIVVKIAETESYDQADAASHSFKGRTPRTDVMFGPAGNLYIYFTYGMHYCCNIVVGKDGEGAAVLLRAAEPLGDTSILSLNRKGRDGIELTNGPAKLCQALQIDKTLSGHDLSSPPLRLRMQPALDACAITTTTRIGLTKEKDRLRRFYITDNAYVSKK